MSNLPTVKTSLCSSVLLMATTMFYVKSVGVGSKPIVSLGLADECGYYTLGSIALVFPKFS